MIASKYTLSFEEFSKRGEWFGQQSLIAGWLERLKWPALDVIDDELMTRTRSTSRFSEFNKVFSTRIAESHLSRDIGRCLETLAEEGVPTNWYLSGHSTNTVIAEQLTALGFDEFKRYNIMARKLSTAVNGKNDSSFGDAQIEQTTSTATTFDIVSDEATLKKWTAALAKVSGYSKALEDDWLDMLLSGGFDADRAWRQYYCKQEGEIVGILSVFWTEQMVSIEKVGVLATHRNHRLGSRLLGFALADALAAGYHVATAYPAGYQQDFFRQNLFENFGALDCVAIGASQQPRNWTGSNAGNASSEPTLGGLDGLTTRSLI